MLQGTTADFGLLDIFRLIALTRKSGTLVVGTSASRGHVGFDDGAVCFAVADAARAAIGVELAQSGLVAGEQVLDLLETARATGSTGSLTTDLLEGVEVDREALEGFLRRWVEDAICTLVELPEASFAFDPGAQVDGAGWLALPTDDLVTEVDRRTAERAAVLARVPAEDAVLALRPGGPADDEAVALSTQQWRVLALLDGRRSVRAVAELSGLDRLAVAEVLADLVDRGLVEVVPAEDPDRALADLLARRDLLRRIAALELDGVPPPAVPAPAPDPFAAAPSAGAPVPTPAPPSAPEPDPAAVSDSLAALAAVGHDPDDPAAVRQAEEAAAMVVAAGAGAAPVPAPATGDQVEDDRDAAAEHQAPVRPLTSDEDVNQGLLDRLVGGASGV